MPALNIILDGDGAFGDLVDKAGSIIHLPDPTMAVVALSHGMESGRASVMVRIDLPDGMVVLAETSMRLFLAAADAFRARYGG